MNGVNRIPDTAEDDEDRSRCCLLPIPQAEVELNHLLRHLDGALGLATEFIDRHDDSCFCVWCQNDDDAPGLCYDVQGLVWLLPMMIGSICCQIRRTPERDAPVPQVGHAPAEADESATVETTWRDRAPLL